MRTLQIIGASMVGLYMTASAAVTPVYAALEQGNVVSPELGSVNPNLLQQPAPSSASTLSAGSVPAAAPTASAPTTLTSANLYAECKKQNEQKKQATCAANAACIASFDAYTHPEALVPYEENTSASTCATSTCMDHFKSGTTYRCRPVRLADKPCVTKCKSEGYVVVPLLALTDGRPSGALQPLMCNTPQRLACREAVTQRVVTQSIQTTLGQGSMSSIFGSTTTSGLSVPSSTSAGTGALSSGLSSYAMGLGTGVVLGGTLALLPSLLSGSNTASQGYGNGAYPYPTYTQPDAYATPPVCTTFESGLGTSPVPPGGYVSLSWVSTGGAVEAASITPGIGSGLVSPVVFKAPSMSTTYTLRLSNRSGVSTCSTRVYVGPAPTTDDEVTVFESEVQRIAQEQNDTTLVNPLVRRTPKVQPGYGDTDVDGEAPRATPSVSEPISAPIVTQRDPYTTYTTPVSARGNTQLQSGNERGEGSFVVSDYLAETQHEGEVRGGGDLAGYEASLRAQRPGVPRGGVEQIASDVWGRPSGAVTGTLATDTTAAVAPVSAEPAPRPQGFFAWLWSIMLSVFGVRR